MRRTVESCDEGLEVVHGLNGAPISAYRSSTNAPLRALSDERRLAEDLLMNQDQDDGGPRPEAILAANLVELYRYYKEQWKDWNRYVHSEGEGEPPPPSEKALALKSGVSRRTLAAIRAGRPAQIDTLHAIARTYGLRVYQLLVPDLDPGNPSIVAVTETERELVKAVRLSMKRERARGLDDGESGAGSAGSVGSDTTGTEGGPKVEPNVK